ncbi:MAG: hypothetical protein HYV29_03105 [Ignavibacteriales bacterium]|nr:hypothetical protein [Ignavibacteriales bacterium]
MKRAIYLFLSVLVSIGCEQSNTPSTTTEPTSNSGNIVFTFDKANTPAAVKTLTATLSRSGFTTLTKTINILTDTSATMLFSEVAVGTWKVKVDAKDGDEKILYTGQADVIVLENTLSQVNLTLTPVPTGVGSVQINVTWGGTAEKKWVDYINNPVLTKTGKPIDWGGIGQPKIYSDDGIYRMYYLNYSFPSPVSYAESNDGVNWSRPDSVPILVVGPAGSWDDGGTGPGPVYKVGSKYYMLYQGYNSPTKHFQIGLASSIDGRNWVKHPQPVFTDSLVWEKNMMVASEVEIINEKYYMYYCSGDKIGLAVSSNGLNWERYSTTPILTATQSWENGDISWVSVVKENAGYKMIYTNDDPVSYSNIAFGVATSSDGIHWEKDSKNPIFKHSSTSNHWAAGGIVYPYLTKINNELRIYYTGLTSNGEWKIGFVSYK